MVRSHDQIDYKKGTDELILTESIGTDNGPEDFSVLRSKRSKPETWVK